MTSPPPIPAPDEFDPVDTAGEVEAIVEHPHRPPAWAPLTIAAFVALVVCSNIANVVWADWASDHPAALLALSARLRWLGLAVAGGIGPFSYVAVAAVRLGVAFAVCHLVGRVYRDQALGWLVRFLGQTPESVAAFQRGYGRSELLLVPFFVGSNIVALLSGIHRTPPARLAGLLAVGVAARLALMWWLAQVFDDELLDVLEFVQRYQVPVIVVSILLVFAVNARNLRRGNR